jgi:DGQHR domain-containing protein
MDDEKGAVQRVLSTKRVKEIKDFVLKNKQFFNTFILNWTDNTKLPQYNKERGVITIPIISKAAQVIDGQHRLVGLEEAYKEKSAVGEQEIIVSLCLNLETNQAAGIFLNINSEQKPVPKSLIYDLFGEVEFDKEHPINRAKDIADALNDNEESPYYKCIKYPGGTRGQGTVDLSTIISSLKSYVGRGGKFAIYNITSLENQKAVILNYFNAIKDFYGERWAQKKENPFLKSAGFYGAVECLIHTLLPKCVEKKSFTKETFQQLLALNNTKLLLQSDITRWDGKEQRSKIKDFLESNITTQFPRQEEYEF